MFFRASGPIVFAVVAQALLVPAFAADCDDHFTTAGNFLSGKTFKTYAHLPGVDADLAFRAIHRLAVEDGDNIQLVDKTARMLTSQDRIASANRPMPFNAHVTKTEDGSRVDLSFSIPGGAIATESAVKGAFCRTVSAAGRLPASGEIGPGAIGVEDKAARFKQALAVRATSQAKAEQRHCVATACLGMTLKEAAVLELKPVPAKTLAGPMAFRVGGFGASGLDLTGKPITFGPTRIDRNWIQKFDVSVGTICSTADLTADMTASDGQNISLHFSPSMVNGKAAYRLNRIHRYLPPNRSDSEQRSLVEQLKQRYGADFLHGHHSIEALAHFKTHPKVNLTAGSIDLSLPFEDLRASIMEQPGCSAKVSID